MIQPLASETGATIPVKNGAEMHKNDGSEDVRQPQRLPSLLNAQNFCVGSWNLQGGLHSGLDFDQVIGDLSVRGVQVACLQETHCPEGCLVQRESGKVICLGDSLDTPEVPRYGLGFYLSKSLLCNMAFL